MATRNPTTRANYEPNSWAGQEGGPREDPARGFTTYPSQLAGEKRRLRPESFADHYSQARQFYISQTEAERRHIANAFVFELSKCDEVAIRTRMVAGLRNVHEELAQAVADGLGLSELPEAASAAREPVTDLPPSAALSILANGPDSFAGRKLGVLLTDGADSALLTELRDAAHKLGVTVELVAPTVGGVTTNDGSTISADQKIDGGPSVLYDAVAVVADEDGAVTLAGQPAARDFITDAYAHCKFIGHTAAAASLFDATGLADKLDEGILALGNDGSVDTFFDACSQLRFWPREATFA